MKKILLSSCVIASLAFAGGSLVQENDFTEQDTRLANQAKLADQEVKAPVAAEKTNFYAGTFVSAVATRTQDTACVIKSLNQQNRELALGLNIGYSFIDNLDAEVRFLKGIDTADSQKISSVGLYLKPNFNITNDINLYSLVGINKTNKMDRNNLSKKDSGLSFGAGVDYAINENINLFTDIMNLLNKSDTTSQRALNVGLNYKF